MKNYQNLWNELSIEVQDSINKIDVLLRNSIDNLEHSRYAGRYSELCRIQRVMEAMEKEER